MHALGLASAAATLMLYAAGWQRLRDQHRLRAPLMRAVSFVSGVVIGVLATASPLAARADRTLTLHMVQHLVLLFVVVPLIVHGRPVVVMRAALGPRSKAAVVRAEGTALARLLRSAFHQPLVAAIVASAGLWVWHLPSAYDAAVSSELAHVAEHVTFAATAVPYWALVLAAHRRRSYAGPIGATVVVSLAGAALGAMLTFAPRPLYEVHGALADQQLAGALMWTPPGVIYVALIAVLATGWFNDLARRTDARTVAVGGTS